LVLVVELPSMPRSHLSVDVETKTRFMKEVGEDEESDEAEFKIVKGRKGEVVVPVKKIEEGLQDYGLPTLTRNETWL